MARKKQRNGRSGARGARGAEPPTSPTSPTPPPHPGTPSLRAISGPAAKPPSIDTSVAPRLAGDATPPALSPRGAASIEPLEAHAKRRPASAAPGPTVPAAPVDEDGDVHWDPVSSYGLGGRMRSLSQSSEGAMIAAAGLSPSHGAASGGGLSQVKRFGWTQAETAARASPPALAGARTGESNGKAADADAATSASNGSAGGPALDAATDAADHGHANGSTVRARVRLFSQTDQDSLDVAAAALLNGASLPSPATSSEPASAANGPTAFSRSRSNSAISEVGAGALPEDDFIRYFVKGEDPPQDVAKGSGVSFFDFVWQDLGIEQEEDPGLSSKNASVEDDVFNFIRVPLEAEKVLFFGFFLCADSLLFMLVYLPLRIIRAMLLLMIAPFRPRRPSLRFHRTQFYDLLRGFIILVAFLAVLRAPMSRIYHYVRGQTFMKLYVIFNMLDIFDRLMCSFGQDILDSLFYMTKTSPRAYVGITFRLILGSVYATLHTLLYFVRLITLNVAINSSSNALLTILISNNFVELKGSVFKRFAEQNLFQITCSDIVERFELFVFLMLTSLQHPASWSDFFYSSAVYVCVCEFLVDWIKHAFITKFNRISYHAYRDEMEALCRDIAPVGTHKHPYANSQRLGVRPVDPTQAVAQRIGLATLPLTCVTLRFVWANAPHAFRENPFTAPNLVCAGLVFICLLLLKTFINLMLRGHACAVLMSRERKILQRTSPRLSSLPSTPNEKELQKAIVAKHMQKISNLAGIRRYQIYKSRVPT